MFIPYICCGDPQESFTMRLAKALEPHSDLLEFGIPFSDPIADGPAIQAASQRALLEKMNSKKVFACIKQLRGSGFMKPIALMAYYNTVYSFGAEKFLNSMRDCGSNLLVIPDLPFHEDIEFEAKCRGARVSPIKMVSLSTPLQRAREMLKGAANPDEFVYLVSRKGITGADNKISAEALNFVKGIRSIAGPEKRLFVGFGVSAPEQAVEYLRAGATGVIVGSHIINMYSKFMKRGKIEGEEKCLAEIASFSRDMASAMSMYKNRQNPQVD